MMNDETRRFLFVIVIAGACGILVGHTLYPFLSPQQDLGSLEDDLNRVMAGQDVIFTAVLQSSYWNSCTPDLNTVQDVEIPLDDQGTVRKMQALVIYCPVQGG